VHTKGSPATDFFRAGDDVAVVHIRQKNKNKNFLGIFCPKVSSPTFTENVTNVTSWRLGLVSSSLVET
jgi:hypothetical protein